MKDDKDYGNLDGLGHSARFSLPQGIAVGHDGNLYVANRDGIRRISLETGYVSTIQATVDLGWFPAITVSSDGHLYVTSTGRSAGRSIDQIHKIFLPSEDVSTVDVSIRDSVRRTMARPGFYSIIEVSNGDLYVADSGNHRIIKVTTTFVPQTTIGGTEVLPDIAANSWFHLAD
jgi:streptogramin lyase